MIGGVCGEESFLLFLSPLFSPPNLSNPTARKKCQSRQRFGAVGYNPGHDGGATLVTS